MPKLTAFLFALSVTLPVFAMDIHGVVTFRRVADRYFFMEDEAGLAWRVRYDVNEPRVKVGDVVTVEGAREKAFNRRLTASEVIVRGKNAEVQTPKVCRIADLMVDPVVDRQAEDLYGRLVAVQGTVRDVFRRQTFMQMIVGDDNGRLQITVPYKLDRPAPEDLKIGARVRASGLFVYTVATDPVTREYVAAENQGVLTLTDQDLVVISTAPFWTPTRFWILIAVLLLMGGVLVFWVKSHEKAKAMAVQRERLRLSRDLHDGFQQLLAGAMFRLEAAMNFLPDDADEAREQLERVSDSLYHTQTGLRAALWSMTEESEGPRALSGLVQYAAGRLPHWTGVVNFVFKGEERNVPSSISGPLLMILHEAVGNALRHGGASFVDVKFSFRASELVLSIRDNGCGFDPEQVETRGHVGLRSMRERVRSMNGTMTITSEADHGTLIVARIPYGVRV